MRVDQYTDEERNTDPGECSCCGSEVPLTNYSRDYGGYQGPHWLCQFCEVTQTAAQLGAGQRLNELMTVVMDVAAMLNVLTPDPD